MGEQLGSSWDQSPSEKQDPGAEEGVLTLGRASGLPSPYWDALSQCHTSQRMPHTVTAPLGCPDSPSAGALGAVCSCRCGGGDAK